MMASMNVWARGRTALSMAALLALAACGGGGGGSSQQSAPSASTLSGTAAGGAAVMGNVIVTDSTGQTKSAPIEADGSYTVDVTGMTGPFVLKAAGTVGNTGVTYYSAATQADVGGTVNVTPFTNLMLSNIAAQLAETYFSNPANIASIGTLITPAKLMEAQAALKAKLQPVLAALGVSDSIDLLRTAFAADHTGLDAVLDLVKVETDPVTNIATIKNALTGLSLGADNLASPTDDAEQIAATGVTPEAATDLQLVMAKLDRLASLIATRLPTPQEVEDSGIFDTSASFMMSGANFAQFVSELSTDPSAVGLKFSNVDITPDEDHTPGVLILTATESTSAGDYWGKLRLKMLKTATGWLVQGDGRMVDLDVQAQAFKSGSYMGSGLHVDIDPFAYNSNHVGAEIVSAVVTGPGLPGSGVTFEQNGPNTWMVIQGLGHESNWIAECTPAGPSQCIDISEAVDNGTYRVVLKNAAGASLNGAGYPVKLAKKPYASSELSGSMFPEITSLTIDGVPFSPAALSTGSTLSASWTMPSSLRAAVMDIWATNTASQYFRLDKDLNPMATSVMYDISEVGGTVTEAGLWLESRDAYGRIFGLDLNFVE